MALPTSQPIIIPFIPHAYESQHSSERRGQEEKMKVKKGWLAVQVSLEEDQFQDGGCSGSNNSQRFVIPISYLYHPLFKGLLDKAYEVYGYHTDGPLKLPSSVDDFLHLCWRIEKESNPHHHKQNHHHHHQQLSHGLYFSC